jgi:glutamine amidotransferase
VIPGVGNFDTVAQQFRTHNLGDFLQIYLEKGGKLIGICLGMQLLFETSDESNSSEGLSIIEGHVRHLGALQIIDVPQIGWASIVGERLTLDEVFFAHSYYVDCPIEYVLLWRQAQDFRYPAAIMAEGVLGMQFHPEKSKGRADSLVLDFLNVGSVKK